MLEGAKSQHAFRKMHRVGKKICTEGRIVSCKGGEVSLAVLHHVAHTRERDGAAFVGA